MKVKGWKKCVPCIWKSKETEVTIFLSDKIDYKIKTVTNDKEGHYIMIRGLIQGKNITVIHIYVTKVGTPKHIRQI